jgi:hypothetical protein
VREQIVDLALDAPELSPQELATRFIDKESYFAEWVGFGLRLNPTTRI